MPNQLMLYFPTNPDGNYNVWETDYTNYTLIYSCSQKSPALKREFIFIMSRSPTLEKTTIDRLKSLLIKNQVDLFKLKINDQSCHLFN
jgi:lipocalin